LSIFKDSKKRGVKKIRFSNFFAIIYMVLPHQNRGILMRHNSQSSHDPNILIKLKNKKLIEEN
jgi:hypothetical protein